MRKLFIALFLVALSVPALCQTPTPACSTSASMPCSTAVTVGSASTIVVTTAVMSIADHVLLINDSDEAIYLNIYGAAAVKNKGIRLNASGGSYEVSKDNPEQWVGLSIYAICASGSKVLCVVVD